MKKIASIITTSVLLISAPLFAIAAPPLPGTDTSNFVGDTPPQPPTTASTNTSSGGGAPSGDSKPHPLEGVGKDIRAIATTTRADIRGDMQQGRDAIQGIASSTRAAVVDDRQAGKQDIQQLMHDRQAALKAMMGSSTPEERQQVRADAKAAIDDKRQEIASSTEAARDEAKQKYGDAVQTSVDNITDKLTQSIGGLSDIADRIDTRISTEQQNGIDMTNSAALLVAARADIATAQDNVTAVDTALAAALASTNPRQNIPTVRTAVTTAETAIKTAKDSLQKVLQSIRTETGDTDNATSTPQSN